MAPVSENRIGNYIRDCRVEANLSLRDAAARIGITHVFLGEIERGRKALPADRWTDFIRAIPSVTRTELEVLTEDASNDSVQLKLRKAGTRYESIGQLLLRRAKTRDVPNPTLDEIIRLLSGE